jgi:hypothetical protein
MGAVFGASRNPLALFHIAMNAVILSDRTLSEA